LKKNGFPVVENSQKTRVSGSGKPGLETLLNTPWRVGTVEIYGL